MKRLFPIFCTLFTLSMLLAAAGPSAGQIPDKFENLKVLPKNISKMELVDMMKRFTGALGVRCWHCHVGEEGQPLSEFDFVSDNKAAKKATRTMIKMVTEINGTFLSKLEDKTSSGLKVDCMTCHHGQTKPRRIEEILEDAVMAHGASSAKTKYTALRSEHYGGFTYDFSEGMLNALADRLMKADEAEAAIEMLNLNLEHYPNSVSTYSTLSEVYLKQGDKSKAIENIKKALEIDPEGPWSGWLAKRLKHLEAEK